MNPRPRRLASCRTRAITIALARAFACLLLVASCDGDRPKASDAPGTVPRSAAAEAAPQSAAPLGAHRPEELVTAASELVGFLRGEVPFARIRLADTVTLQLSPEAGGARRAVAREMLRHPSNWSVRSRPQARAMRYSFAPHQDLTVLTTRVGRHLKCMEYDLASRSPELAALPHVGTMLSPAATDYLPSCLQTWNLTLVFDSAAKPPTLVAAVYDQWEW
jgi:hypothetical protein